MERSTSWDACGFGVVVYGHEKAHAPDEGTWALKREEVVEEFKSAGGVSAREA